MACVAWDSSFERAAASRGVQENVYDIGGNMPVGKSGAGMCCISWCTVMSGLWISALSPSTTSRMLCGGILVAMPTAMPLVPLMRRLGSRAGSTEGSSCGNKALWMDMLWLRNRENAPLDKIGAAYDGGIEIGDEVHGICLQIG